MKPRAINVRQTSREPWVLALEAADGHWWALLDFFNTMDRQTIESDEVLLAIETVLDGGARDDVAAIQKLSKGTREKLKRAVNEGCSALGAVLTLPDDEYPNAPLLARFGVRVPDPPVDSWPWKSWLAFGLVRFLERLHEQQSWFLKRCGDCGDFMLDTSRGGRRIYCSGTCRMRAQRKG